MPTSHIRRERTTNTFVVRVLSTNDKGWAGVVTHVQSGRTMKFKAFIDAVRFMDSFIEGTEGGEDFDPDHRLNPDSGGVARV